jgi:hypothetical protein
MEWNASVADRRLPEVEGGHGAHDGNHPRGENERHLQEFLFLDEDTPVPREDGGHELCVLRVDVGDEVCERTDGKSERETDVQRVPHARAAAHADEQPMARAAADDLVDDRQDHPRPAIDQALASERDHVEIGHHASFARRDRPKRTDSSMRLSRMSGLSISMRRSASVYTTFRIPASEA